MCTCYLEVFRIDGEMVVTDAAQARRKNLKVSHSLKHANNQSITHSRSTVAQSIIVFVIPHNCSTILIMQSTLVLYCNMVRNIQSRVHRAADTARLLTILKQGHIPAKGGSIFSGSIFGVNAPLIQVYSCRLKSDQTKSH